MISTAQNEVRRLIKSYISFMNIKKKKTKKNNVQKRGV